MSVCTEKEEYVIEDNSTFIVPIDFDIPMPEARPKGKNVGRRITWPFATMNVGDSCLVPEWADEGRARAYLCKMRREKCISSEWRFAVRQIAGRARIWRVE